jgi:hypothetical protein
MVGFSEIEGVLGARNYKLEFHRRYEALEIKGSFGAMASALGLAEKFGRAKG